MKAVRVRAERSSVLACFAVLGTLTLAPSLIGCSGGSEGGQNGSGGNSSSSGGASSSGGSNGSGGNSGSGGKVGTGGSGSGSGGSGSGGSSSGSGGSGSGGSTATANCDAPGMIFHDSTVGCLGSGCHSPGSGNQPPDLSGNDGSVLKGLKSTVLCSNSLIVDPANPTNSVMYKVLSGTSCLIQMRVGGPFLDSTQLDCVKAWISNIK